MDLTRTINLFEGNVEYGPGGELAGGGYTANQPYIRDWVYRHEGLQKAIYNHSILAEALGNGIARGRYINKKRANLNDIAKNLRDLFKIEYLRHLNAGNTQEQSKKNAMKFVNEYKKKALEMHEKQFPEDFSYAKVMDLLKIKKNGVEHIKDE